MLLNIFVKNKLKYCLTCYLLSRTTNSMISWVSDISPWKRAILLPITSIASLYIITNLSKTKQTNHSRTVVKEDVKWGIMISILGLNIDLDKHEFFEHLPEKNYFTSIIDSNYFNSSIWRKLGSIMAELRLFLLLFCFSTIFMNWLPYHWKVETNDKAMLGDYMPRLSRKS